MGTKRICGRVCFKRPKALPFQPTIALTTPEARPVSGRREGCLEAHACNGRREPSTRCAALRISQRRLSTSHCLRGTRGCVSARVQRVTRFSTGNSRAAQASGIGPLLPRRWKLDRVRRVERRLRGGEASPTGASDTDESLIRRCSLTMVLKSENDRSLMVLWKAFERGSGRRSCPTVGVRARRHGTRMRRRERDRRRTIKCRRGRGRRRCGRR